MRRDRAARTWREGPRLKIDLTTGMYRFELEKRRRQRPFRRPRGRRAPATASSPPSSGGDARRRRTCPPGKQCVLFYPQEAKDKAKGLMKKGRAQDRSRN